MKVFCLPVLSYQEFRLLPLSKYPFGKMRDPTHQDFHEDFLYVGGHLQVTDGSGCQRSYFVFYKLIYFGALNAPSAIKPIEHCKLKNKKIKQRASSGKLSKVGTDKTINQCPLVTLGNTTSCMNSFLMIVQKSLQPQAGFSKNETLHQEKNSPGKSQLA